MTTSHQRLAELVTVDAEFKPSVQLPADFEHPELNARLIKSYIPTSDSIALFTEIAQSLNPNSTERARTLVGTYGTGKSDLLLLISNYLSRPVDDPVMQPFYQRLQAADPDRYTIIYEQRDNKPPFLVVLLQADPNTRFPGFVLHGLNHALEQHGLSDVMASTKYDAAREQLERWERENNPLLQTFSQHLQKNESRENDGLRRELASSQADQAFLVFQRIFEKITSTEFNIHSYSKPDEAFVQVTRTLRDRGTHSGIVLICDEFTEFLRRFERAIDQQSDEVDSETMAVQNVAERSTSSGQAQLHFLIASLESFAAASMESKSGQASKAIERVGGRFKQHSLAIQAGEELIKGAIRKQQDGILLPNRQRDALLDLATPIWKQQGRDREWVRSVIIEGTFPLHPLTTYALPLINRRVAQSQRTMFQFLQSNEGLMGFVERESLATRFTDWHTLLTLDVLFDYFHESITTRKPDLDDAYNHSLQALHTATVDIQLAERVLKVITFCEVVAPDEMLSPTRTRLQQALNLPPEASSELQKALDILEKVEAVYPPESENGLYTLPMPGRVSVFHLRRKVRDACHTLPTSVEALQAQYAAQTIEAKQYNQKRGSHRELAACYVGAEILNQGTRLKKDLENAPDALLWYVVATSDTERATAQSAARELTTQHEHLVVAVPVNPLQILGALRDYKALEQVRNDPELEGNAKAYLLDTGTVGKPYKTALDAALETLHDVRQWEWFMSGSGHTVQSQQKVYEVVSNLMEQLFRDTPPHTLASQFKPGSPSSSLKKAVESIIKGDVQIEKTSKGAVENILRKSASSFGVLKLDRTEGSYNIYRASEPEAGLIESRKVWRLIRENLVAGKSWSSIVAALRKPPYGLYDSLLLVYLATFITYYADSIEVESKKALSGRPNIDMNLLDGLLTRPQEYTLRFHPLSDAERRWLRGIVEYGIKKPLASSTTQGKSLRASVADQVQAWLKKINLPIFVESLSLEAVQEMLPEIPQTTLSAALLMIQHNQNLAAVLMDDIPQALGAPADRTQWGDEDVGELLARFAEVCSIVEQLPRTLQQYVAQRIATLFGCEDLPAEQQWNAIYEWRQKRQIVKPESLRTPTRTFFYFINDPRGSIEQTILVDYAKKIIGINTEYLRWTSLDTLTRLEQELQKALQEIEEKWKEAAPGEEVWLNELASIASGRPITSATASDVAQHLVAWGEGYSWPACATTIDVAHVQRLYPDLEEWQCQHIIHLLQRIPYDTSRWEAEVVETLANQFGVQHWRKQEVQEALTRFKTALQQAAQFESLLRQYVLTSTAAIFAGGHSPPTSDSHPPVGEVLAHWYAAHPIPAQNDLSPDAHTLLRHISPDIGDVETVLLNTLPRAFTDIGLSYQQWNTCEMLDHYCTRVQQVVGEINAYVPLTDVEHAWLTGIVTQGLQQPLSETAWEQRRLLSIVAKQLQTWLSSHKLPKFSADLSESDMRELFPNFEEPVVATSRILVGCLHCSPDELASMLLTTLPAALGQPISSNEWNEVSDLLEKFSLVCQLIRSLNERLEQQLYTLLGTALGVADDGDTAATILAEIQDWLKQHILLPGEQLSPNAAAIHKALQTSEADPRSVLLFRLPRKICEVKQSYDYWQTWQTRNDYIAKIREAAQEIEQRGRVGDATSRVQTIWDQFKAQLNELTPDERRWFIKAFNEEFQP